MIEVAADAYIRALEAERDELDREYRRMRALFGFAVGCAIGGLTLATVTAWFILFGAVL